MDCKSIKPFENGPLMSAVLIHFDTDILFITTTDGHILGEPNVGHGFEIHLFLASVACPDPQDLKSLLDQICGFFSRRLKCLMN